MQDGTGMSNQGAVWVGHPRLVTYQDRTRGGRVQQDVSYLLEARGQGKNVGFRHSSKKPRVQ